MPTEETIRAFLLGMADSETEQEIEEGILDGSVATDDLLVTEEELIDDHVFGRLSAEEERSFHTSFLINQERQDKLDFSLAIRTYVMERSPHARERKSSWKFPRLILAASLSLSGLAVLAVVWLGIRDARLSRDLALASRTSDERLRLLTSMREEEQKRAASIENAAKPSAAMPALNARVPVPAPEPGIQLRPGVRRGVEAIPVLHLTGQAGVVRITLEMAYQPTGGLREELSRTGGQRIWSQELSSAGKTAASGATILYVPAELLSPGDYQIRLKDMSTDASDEGDVYAFRVSRQ